MKIFRRKTDDEFVEDIRQGKNPASLNMPLFLCLLLSFLFCVFVVWRSYDSKIRNDRYVETFSKNNSSSDIVEMKAIRSKGFQEGYKVGEFFSRGLMWGMMLIMNCFIFLMPNRRKSLLFKYYDELKKIKKSKEIQ